MLKLKRKAAGIAALVAMAVAAAGWGAEPAVLEKVPGDASAVLVVNNVKNLSQKLSNTLVRMNLPIPIPPDLAGFALRNIGVTKGFDQNNSAAVLVLKEEGDVTAMEPEFVMLLPTTDAKGMIAGFEPGEADEKGITEVTLPKGGKGYVVTVDKWVAMAETKETLTKYLGR